MMVIIYSAACLLSTRNATVRMAMVTMMDYSEPLLLYKWRSTVMRGCCDGGVNITVVC